MDLTKDIVELYRKAATQMPKDVVKELKRAEKIEAKNSGARITLGKILKNVELARKESVPICQDTGTPYFFVSKPRKISEQEVRKAILKATKLATSEVPLRPNSLETLSGKNTGDNTGELFPIINFQEWNKDKIQIQLLLKGAGSENMGKRYSLPDPKLKAERDLIGVRTCILDAVFNAQGNGCPPSVVVVGIGGSKSAIAELANRQLLRKLDDHNSNKELDGFERGILTEINKLGIGPMGFGGKTTALAVKIGSAYRHPASFFVEVSFGCWATRRATLNFKGGKASYG